MHQHFVIRRSPNGHHQIVDVHGRLVATMNGQHHDIEEIAALFLQAPIADFLARQAQDQIARLTKSDVHPITSDEDYDDRMEACEDWLAAFAEYRQALGEVPA